VGVHLRCHRVGLVSRFCCHDVGVVLYVLTLTRNELNVKLGHRRVSYEFPISRIVGPHFPDLIDSRMPRLIIVYFQKLQRAISDFRIQTNTAPLIITLGKRGSPIDGPTQQTDGHQNSREVSQANHSDEGPRQKRKYRRHPKVRTLASCHASCLLEAWD